MIFPDSTLPLPYDMLSTIAGVVLIGGSIIVVAGLLWGLVSGWDFEHPVRTPFIIGLVALPAFVLGGVSASLAGGELKAAEAALVEQAEEVYGLEINEPVAEELLGPSLGLWGLGHQVELLRAPAGSVTFLSEGENLTVTLVWTGAEWVLVEGSETAGDDPHQELPRAEEAG